MFDLVHNILAHRVYGTLLRIHGLFYVWGYWIDPFPGSRIGYLEVQCERSEMDLAGRLLSEEIRGIVSKGVDVRLFAAITRGMARAPKHGEEYLEQLANQACLAQIAGQSCKWMSQYQSILNSISASDINLFARSVLNPKKIRIGSVGSADAKELAKAFGISHSLKRNPQQKSPVQEISDTSGWSPERIQDRLTEVKAILGWARTKGSAAKWWTAFEEENKERLGLVLRLAEELAFRRATIAQFFLSYVYSDTDEDIQANLHFLDFQRRCKVLKRSIKTTKPTPKQPLEKDLRRSLLLIRQKIRYEASHPMAKLWWTKIEHKWQRRIPVIEQIANELSAKHGNLNDLFWSAVRCRIHDPKAAFHYYMFHRLAGEYRDRKVLKKLDADGDDILPCYAEQNHRVLEDRLLSERMRTVMAGIRAEGDERKGEPFRSLDEFISNWTFMLRHFDGIHVTEDCPDALNLFLEDVGPIVADHLARDEPIDLISIGEEITRSMKYLIPMPEMPWKLLMTAVDRLGEGAKLSKIQQIASDLESAYPGSINQYAPALLQRLQTEKDKPGT